MAEDDEMEMESILHDDTTIDTLSKAEKFYFKYAATNGKKSMQCLNNSKQMV